MPTKQFTEKEIVRDKLISKEKETGKHEKGEKVEKEHKDQKDQKDAPDTTTKNDKDKAEKEHKEQKGENKETKTEKEHKVEKEHKLEGKEHKLEGKENLIEKAHKEAELQAIPSTAAPAQAPTAHYKFVDKLYYEKFFEKVDYFEKHYKDQKDSIEGVHGGVSFGGPVEERLTALEATVTQLLHFIPESLRPDLTQGALKQEPDAAKPTDKADSKQTDPKAKS